MSVWVSSGKCLPMYSKPVTLVSITTRRPWVSGLLFLVGNTDVTFQANSILSYVNGKRDCLPCIDLFTSECTLHFYNGLVCNQRLARPCYSRKDQDSGQRIREGTYGTGKCLEHTVFLTDRSCRFRRKTSQSLLGASANVLTEVVPCQTQVLGTQKKGKRSLTRYVKRKRRSASHTNGLQVIQLVLLQPTGRNKA